LPRLTIGKPALRAALVSIEINAFTFFWKDGEAGSRLQDDGCGFARGSHLYIFPSED
jgi:hypothetical protein